MAPLRMSHLLTADAELFQRYLDQYPDRYTQVDFDIRVGFGRDPGDRYPDNIRTMAVHLSQRRIDAVGFRPGQIDIIEVTLSAGLKALGQLNAYPTLYQQSYFPVLPLQPVLVAAAFSTDAEDIFRASGIDTYILPE